MPADDPLLTTSCHTPVLLNDVLEQLDPQPGQIMVDGTLGGGGHALAMAKRLLPGGYVIALDRDEQAVQAFRRRYADQPVRAIHASYADLPEILAQLQVPAVAGLLLDLGISSDQLADAERGFSFRSDGDLDMRFDRSRGEPAWRLLARLSEKHLADLIFAYGEERFSRRIARAIVARRHTRPLRRACELGDLIEARGAAGEGSAASSCDPHVSSLEDCCQRRTQRAGDHFAPRIAVPAARRTYCRHQLSLTGRPSRKNCLSRIGDF